MSRKFSETNNTLNGDKPWVSLTGQKKINIYTYKMYSYLALYLLDMTNTGQK